MPKAALHNLGCKVNAYETEAMEQQLKERGYEIVPFDEKADVYIINTCSVTNIADRKSRQMLHRAKKLNPESVVVAAGCYVQVASEELKKDASVDIVIGNNKKAELADILDEYLGNVHEKEEAEVFVTDLSHGSDYEALHLEQPSDHTRAFIKVQDGVISSAVTVSFPLPEAESAAEAVKMWSGRSPDWWLRDIKRLFLQASI